MVTYLLNASLVWLVCLVLYDLFFRKETFHSQNRIFLTASVLAGFVLPLIQWETTSVARINPDLETPLETISRTKQNVVATSAAAADSFNTVTVLWMIYFIGVSISIILMIREMVALLRLYGRGHHSKQSSFTIVYTGQPHSPFSFFKTIFVSGRDQYTPEEWNALIAHEMAHGNLYHSIDKLMLLFLRGALWFHPLVHLYYNRLIMVHEYQADEAGVKNIDNYETFLLEQTLLAGAPSFTHSFSSPIKNRIFMLTRTSSKSHLFKYFLAAPVVLLLILICTNTGFSFDKVRKGNIIYVNGNKIEMKGFLPDTIPVFDPVTGESTVKVVTRDSLPFRLNEEPIYSDDNKSLFMPVINGNENSMEEFIFNSLLPALNKLPDGDYRLAITNMVVDKNGKLVYYELGDFGANWGMKDKISIPDNIKAEINQRVRNALENDVSFKPATLKGKKVNAVTSVWLGGKHKIVVVNHKATLE